MRRPACLALLAAAPFLLSACVGNEIDAEFVLADECRVAILPADDPEYGGILGSARGEKIARLATSKVEEELGEEIVVPTSSYLKTMTKVLRRSLRQSPLQARDDNSASDSMGVQDFADLIRSEYLLYTRIKKWETRSDGAVNFLRGRAVLEVTLYDTRKEVARVVKSIDVVAKFPEDWSSQYGVFEVNGQENAIDRGLTRVAARKIAELFYEHDDPDALKPRRE